MLKYFLLILLLFGQSVYACTQIAQPPYNANTYYSSISSQSGESLKAALNLIVRDHTDYSYTPCVWDILQISDEHPTDSNSVIGFYTRRAIFKTNRDQGGNTPDFWNREHIWPRSHGFPNTGQHAFRDVHALRPADKSVNADRSDDDFAEGGTPDIECTLCNEGPGTWEPPDEVKGDTARMMFYMVVRYEGGDNSGVSDLELVDSLTSSSQNLMGKLCDLVQWHVDDPVSFEEMARNDVIYSWQGNRNPFVDHPEYVIPIWGDSCGIAASDVPVKQVPFPPVALVITALLMIIVVRRVNA